MIVTLNGEDREFADGTTVAGLVEALGLPAGRRGVAVAVAAEVVPRSAWEQHVLADGARVEIVHAVQGG